MLLAIVLLCSLLFYGETWNEAVSKLADFHWKYLVPLLLVTIAIIWISCVKWNLFLVRRDIKVSLFYLMTLYMVGRFFDNFMPSTLGSDASRTILLARSTGRSTVALASVVLERFTGLIGLLLVATVFATASTAVIDHPEIGIAIASILGLMLVAVLTVAFARKLSGPITLFVEKLGAGSKLRKLRLLHSEITFFPEEGSHLGKCHCLVGSESPFYSRQNLRCLSVYCSRRTILAHRNDRAGNYVGKYHSGFIREHRMVRMGIFCFVDNGRIVGGGGTGRRGNDPCIWTSILKFGRRAVRAGSF